MQLHTLLSLAMTFASVGIVLIILVLSALLIFYRAVWRKKKGGPMHLPWRRILWWCVFACYCFVVLCATIFMRFPSEMPERAYPLFYSYQEAWITGSESSWRNIILNFCMFMPLGFLLPLGWKRLQRGLWILLAGFGFSLMIECVQLLSRRGMFEPDDLLGNTVGALIGYGFFLLWDELRKKAMKKLWKKFPQELPRSPKRVLAAQLPLLLTALAFLILFVKYQSMPLGVHPDEPLDRPNKKYLTVTSTLEFPSEGENLVASSGYQAALSKQEYILSEKEAYEKIEKGDFQCDEEFRSKAIDLVITDCELTYAVDSKGFLQPTYAFTGTLNGKETTIKIPALR